MEKIQTILKDFGLTEKESQITRARANNIKTVPSKAIETRKCLAYGHTHVS